MAKPRESYLGLSAKEQAEILTNEALERGVIDAVLEKDIWLCLVLQTMFDQSGRPGMAFKGGTSLSKVFHAIQRFSEDIDITINWEELNTGYTRQDVAKLASGTQKRKAADAIKMALEIHVRDVTLPYLKHELEKTAGVRVEYEKDVEDNDVPDKLRIHYPSACKTQSARSYLKPSILVEFGAKNEIEPNAKHEIRPEIAGALAMLDFPVATVDVLAPDRTFWEKATLLHDEYHRPGGVKANAERLSRHWYDLARLADTPICAVALGSVELLENVVDVKKLFFSYKHSQYDDCVAGRFRLIPDVDSVKQLQTDYQLMVDERFFYGDVIAFADIIARLQALEAQINHVIPAAKAAAPATGTTVVP